MLSFTDILKAIKSKFLWILGSLILVGGIMYYVTSKMDKKFKSKAQFSTGITEVSEITFGESKEVNQPFAIAQRFTNLIEMMRSRNCVNMLQYRLLEHELVSETPFRKPNHVPPLTPAFKKELLKYLHKKLDSNIVLISSLKLDQDIINYLKLYHYEEEELFSKILIKRVPDSDFIMIEVESEDAQLSAFIANTYVREFITFYDVQKSTKSAGSVNFFERMAKLKKRELDEKVNELKAYKLRNRVINLYEQTKSIVNQLSSVEIMREQENMKISSRGKAADEIDEKFTSKEKKYYEVVSLKINKDIEEIKNKIAVLNNRYLTSNMNDVAAKDSVLILRESMDKLILQASDEAIMNPNEVKKELIARKLHSELEVEIAIKTVASIDKDIERLQGIISSFAPMEASIGAFEREISVASEVYLLVLNKLNVAQFSALNDNNSLKQAEFAQAADHPESSKKVMILALSLGLTLILSFMIVVGLAYFDQTFYSVSRFKEISGFNTIGFLPLLNNHELSIQQIFENNSTLPEERLFVRNVRKIRQVLESNNKDDKFILFTGTKNAEGKSLLVLALAYAFGLRSKKVLIIDANFRNANLTKMLNAKAYLSPLATENIENAITQTQYAFVDILGCEVSNLSPSEIFGQRLSSNDFEMIKSKYDYIFIEGPSLQLWSDSRELSDYVDKVITVFAAHHSLSVNDNEAISFIEGLGDKHIGAVLNKVTSLNIPELKLHKNS